MIFVSLSLFCDDDDDDDEERFGTTKNIKKEGQNSLFLKPSLK